MHNGKMYTLDHVSYNTQLCNVYEKSTLLYCCIYLNYMQKKHR